MGVTVSIGPDDYAQVTYVQKRVTHDILKSVRRARSKGHTIAFDIDDLGDALWWFTPRPLFKRMISLCDFVTVDTRDRAEMLRSQYRLQNVEIIPDSVDYYPDHPVQLHVQEAVPLRILWFGTFGNATLFERQYRALLELTDVEIVLASHSGSIDAAKLRFPRATFLPWSRAGMVNILQSCHLSCLSHDGNEIDRMKSNNKMITSISWGVPAVVSDTPEYSRTAREAGVGYAIFRDDCELLDTVQQLRSADARRQYIQTAQARIWQDYSPAAIANIFLRAVAKYSIPRKESWFTRLFTC